MSSNAVPLTNAPVENVVSGGNSNNGLTPTVESNTANSAANNVGNYESNYEDTNNANAPAVVLSGGRSAAGLIVSGLVMSLMVYIYWRVFKALGDDCHKPACDFTGRGAIRILTAIQVFLTGVMSFVFLGTGIYVAAR